MIQALLGRKISMGRVVDEKGEVVATTVLSVGPCQVTQIKSVERDGYEAVQIGYVESKRLSKPKLGHLKDAPPLRYLREVAAEPGASVGVGDKFDVSLFTPGEEVHVIGVSKGRGFAGGMRRHGFHGGPKTHGQSDRWRAPGAIGAGTTPGRVLPGTRMAGHMGARRVTVKNLEVLAVDAERNLLAVKGGVPGPRGGLLMIKKTRTTSAGGEE
ncbi:MAG TPA: 50S ribosomal protein L3 [Chloroflexota bacterium]